MKNKKTSVSLNKLESILKSEEESFAYKYLLSKSKWSNHYYRLTVLQQAIKEDRLSVVSYLVKQNIHFFMGDKNLLSICLEANASQAICELLWPIVREKLKIDRKMHISVLGAAITAKGSDQLAYVLSKGLMLKSLSGKLLCYAIRSQDLRKVQLLISHGADINMQYRSKTALERSIMVGKMDIILLLLKSGCDSFKLTGTKAQVSPLERKYGLLNYRAPMLELALRFELYPLANALLHYGGKKQLNGVLKRIVLWRSYSTSCPNEITNDEGKTLNAKSEATEETIIKLAQWLIQRGGNIDEIPLEEFAISFKATAGDLYGANHPITTTALIRDNLYSIYPYRVYPCQYPYEQKNTIGDPQWGISFCEDQERNLQWYKIRYIYCLKEYIREYLKPALRTTMLSLERLGLSNGVIKYIIVIVASNLIPELQAGTMKCFNVKGQPELKRISNPLIPREFEQACYPSTENDIIALFC